MLAPSAAERGAQPPVCQAPGGAENRARQQLTGCGHAPNMTTDHLISRTGPSVERDRRHFRQFLSKLTVFHNLYIRNSDKGKTRFTVG